jgi:capsular exopolysaccharide synthesis family protein
MLRELVDPLEWLREHLDVGFVNDSEILRIALRGDHPEELEEVVNEITTAYMNEVVYVERSQRRKRLDLLQSTNSQRIEKLKTQRATSQALAETLGTNNQQVLGLKQTFDLENQAILDKELLQVRSQKRRLEAEISTRRKLVETSSEGDGSSSMDLAVEAALENEPSIVSLQQHLDKAEEVLHQHTSVVNKTARRPGADPMLGQLQADVRRARSELNAQRKSLRPMVVKQLKNQPVGQDANSIPSLVSQLEVLADYEKRLESERSNQVVVAQEKNSKNLDLQAIQDEIEQAQRSTSKMSDEIQALDVELEAPARVIVNETAVVPTASDAKRRYMMLGMITMGAFLASVAAVTLLELQSRRVMGPVEIASDMGLRIMGTLPAVPTRAVRGNVERQRLQQLQHEQLMAESADFARTMLLSTIGHRAGSLIGITSAVGGEGKTSLACHLGISMARSGRKTLLIDADMRKPMLNRIFEMPLASGLSEILRGEAAVEDGIVSTSVTDLDLIPAGEADSRSMRSLSLGGISPVLDRLRTRYDCVIVDTAPVLPITDTLLIAPYTDGVILSVLNHVSRSHQIAEAQDRLKSVGVRVLGVVFAGDRSQTYRREYYPAYNRELREDKSRKPEEAEATVDADC